MDMKTTVAHRRLFIYISDFAIMQGTPKSRLKEFFICKVWKLKYIWTLSAIVSRMAEKLQETEPYILCCISFSDSGSTLRKGGRQ